jgi:molecular chaperone Hsp33
MPDRLLKFMFHGAPVRGELVRVAGAWREMTAHHSYPRPVKQLLGEMVAAAALLASTIKFNGALVMQVHGDGPIQLLVVECQPDLALRATAKVGGDPIVSGASMRDLVNRRGRGRFAITLDPRDALPGQQPYQGIVPLDGESMSEVLEAYMRQSEQLETRLMLAADDEACAGLLLQRLPESGGSAKTVDEDAWDRVTTLGATVKTEELLRLSPEDLARRLYGQEMLDLQATRSPRFACRCSRERIGRMLISLGRDEVDSIIEELQHVTVTCDFCSRQYSFDAVDVSQLFTRGATQPAAQTTRH